MGGLGEKKGEERSPGAVRDSCEIKTKRKITLLYC